MTSRSRRPSIHDTTLKDWNGDALPLPVPFDNGPSQVVTLPLPQDCPGQTLWLPLGGDTGGTAAAHPQDLPAWRTGDMAPALPNSVVHEPMLVLPDDPQSIANFIEGLLPKFLDDM